MSKSSPITHIKRSKSLEFILIRSKIFAVNVNRLIILLRIFIKHVMRIGNCSTLNILTGLLDRQKVIVQSNFLVFGSQ